MKEIVNAYNDKGDDTGVKQIQSNGVHVGGERFVVLKADERSIYGKKVCIARTLSIISRELPTAESVSCNLSLSQFFSSQNAVSFSLALYTEKLQGKEGIVIVKTTQAILVAHYPETVQPGQAANTVEQLGDYLVGVGY